MKKRELEKRIVALERAVEHYRCGHNALIGRVLELEKGQLPVRIAPAYPPCTPYRPLKPWAWPRTWPRPYPSGTYGTDTDGVFWTYTASNVS